MIYLCILVMYIRASPHMHIASLLIGFIIFVKGGYMIYIQESEGIKQFIKYVEDIGDEDVAIISTLVYFCMELFKFKYQDISSWVTVPSRKSGWLNYLSILEKDILLKEINHELPYGTSKGVYLTTLFFKEVAINDDEDLIQILCDYMDIFNQIGFQILNNSISTSNTINIKSKKPMLQAHLH